MKHKLFNWPNGGNIDVMFSGEGNSALTITSTKNTTKSARSMYITLKTTDGSATIKIHVVQHFKSLDFGIDFNNDFCTR